MTVPANRPPGASPRWQTGPMIALGTGILVACAVLTLAVAWAQLGLDAIRLDGASTLDKYHEADFATCDQFTERTSAIPPRSAELARNWSPKFQSGFLVCGFGSNDPAAQYVSLDVYWHGPDNSESGTKRTAGLFTGFSFRGKDHSPVGLDFADQARWLPGSNRESCGVLVLDHNALFSIDYTPANPDRNTQTCRTQLRTIARTLHTAAQPR